MFLDAETTVKEKTLESPDSDIEQVINFLLDHNIQTTGLNIIRKNGSVWLQPEIGYPQEELEKLAKLTDKTGEIIYHEEKNCWEVPV